MPPKGVTGLSEYSMGKLTIWVKFEIEIPTLKLIT